PSPLTTSLVNRSTTILVDSGVMTVSWTSSANSDRTTSFSNSWVELPLTPFPSPMSARLRTRPSTTTLSLFPTTEIGENIAMDDGDNEKASVEKVETVDIQGTAPMMMGE